MKTIYEFKPGDEVVRICPAKSLGPITGLMGQVIERTGDRSFIGEKLIFKCIANGCAYFSPTKPIDIELYGDKLIDLPLDIWEDGWDYYVDPNTLTDNNYSNINSKKKFTQIISENWNYENISDIDVLNKKLEEALSKDTKDGYKEAERIKTRIEQLNKKSKS